MKDFSSSSTELNDEDSRIAHLEQRRKLYPGLYKTNEEAQAAIEKYAVEEIADINKRARLDSSCLSDDIGVEEPIAVKMESNEDTATKLRRPIYSNADIWGAIPAQEPKYLVECQICNRQVAVSRFAPHLDKCMGLGTVRGNVGNGSMRGTNANR
ncbi:hypothetical protein MPSEU_000278300 [Mayamaea pseudoterrestris]|nr:hypothetical protein MPSEU_000278300 [Mayamaea pseudoterrestris]